MARTPFSPERLTVSALWGEPGASPPVLRDEAVLLVRSFLKGEPSKTVAAELGLHYSTVLELRHDLQANARWQQPDTPLTDTHTETAPSGYPMFQNAEKKARNTLLRLTHLGDAPTSGGGVAPMRMTAPRLWARSVGKQGRSACE